MPSNASPPETEHTLRGARPRRRTGVAARLVIAVAIVSVGLAAGPARSQQSANEELDRCMRDAAITGAGAGGAVGGLIGSLFGERARERVNRALGGAAIGAAVGGIAAWHLSYKGCAERFASASSLVTEAYSQCAARFGYARAGLDVAIDGNALPAIARGGQRVETDVHYHVLTPDPKDVRVELSRRFLCKDENGQFNELAAPVERFTVSSGCHASRGGFPLPSQVPAEQECRMEVSLSAEGVQREHVGTFRIAP